MKSNIGILGWGSLLWDANEQFDRWHEPWQFDGPVLKLEFSRISQTRAGALTLVIDLEHGCPVTSAWCLSKRSEPDDAISDLRCREGTTLNNIGRLDIRSDGGFWRSQEVKANVSNWAREKRLDVVVWTDLASNFAEKTNRSFSIEAAVSYLGNLSREGKAKAAEYVLRAPDFVKTPLRTMLEQEKWFPVKSS